MSLEAGTKLSRYEIRSKIGEGGMGEVYLAHDTRLDRKVALKILPADVASDPGRMYRFVQEAKSASGLNHPNIITIYEIDEADSRHFIAMEFVEGETLRERMALGPLPLSEAVKVATQTAGALAAAHEAGIIHRDIKPDNILLTSGTATVTDFGVAKAISASREGRREPSTNRTGTITLVGTSIGTPAYMAPEQAAGDPATDYRADL
ncbi:MAG TPA: serine/threonine-protein kinase, partial [Pyrinomonadaceae bacterium]|nr:serine/threonine-protein kinase [Pyrinomonadaceae bacterium]